MLKFVGLDVGNANTKVAIGDELPKLIVNPSTLTEQTPGPTSEFTLLAGADEWVGRSWSIAPSESGLYPLDARFQGYGKPKLALPLLIASVWAELPEESRLKVALSIHNRTLAQSMADALNGKHVVQRLTRNGQERKELVIEVVLKTSEAAGVLESERATSGSNCLVDIGGGTVGVLSTIGQQLNPDCKPYFLDDLGFRALIAEFCKHDDCAMACSPRAMRFEQARSLLEKYKRNRGLFGGADLNQAIEAEVARWWASVWDQVNRQAANHLSRANAIYCTGGALLLPQVAAIVKQSGLTPVKAPIDGNARGLWSLAKQRAGVPVTAVRG